MHPAHRWLAETFGKEIPDMELTDEVDGAVFVSDMPDVTQADKAAYVTAFLVALSIFGIELTPEQIAAVTLLAVAVIGWLPHQDTKRRKHRNETRQAELHATSWNEVME